MKHVSITGTWTELFLHISSSPPPHIGFGTPSSNTLFTLRKPKIIKAKRDLELVSFAGSVTEILILISLPSMHPNFS